MSALDQPERDPEAGTAASDAYVHECPFCRRTFPETSMACHGGCPMASHCGALCCPHCGYEFIDTRSVASRFERIRSWFRFFRRKPESARQEQSELGRALPAQKENR